MRVSLAPRHLRADPFEGSRAERLLAPAGPFAVLGGSAGLHGVVLAWPDGPLFVCDTEQYGLAGKGDTGKGDDWAPAQRDSPCWPYSVAACGTRLVIAGNHVLLRNAAP